MNCDRKKNNLQDILTEKQVKCLISKHSKSNNSQLLKYELSPATENMSGFLGDHLKLNLHVKDGDLVKIMHIFIKTMPTLNAPKCEFINDCNFFGRESLVFEIFEMFAEEEFSDSNPWGVKAFIYNNNILVLPNLSVEGYKTYPATQNLDLDHVLVTLGSLARFHAAFAKNETLVGRAGYDNKLDIFLKDPQFYDGIWLRAAIRTTMSILKEFSTNIKQYPLDLEKCLTKWYIEACNSLRDYDDTLNVIIHKDLWVNNVLFKYSGDKPVNAILIDFQCARYAPPAIDVMVFLYYTTSRKFREKYERELLDHYYSVFSASIDEPTRRRLDKLNYNKREFFNLCEKLRPAGLIVPVVICQFTTMSSQAAQESFDDPNTFHKHFLEDRCELVCKYARENKYYKTRLLEISEEFVERHLVKTRVEKIYRV